MLLRTLPSLVQSQRTERKDDAIDEDEEDKNKKKESEERRYIGTADGTQSTTNRRVPCPPVGNK